MIDGDPDTTLVARCLDGDASAFEPIVKRYERVLYNVAYRMVGSREDARDIVQAAFVKAWEKLSTFDPKYRFFSWIYRIVVNESLNTRTRRVPTRALDPDLPAPGGPFETARSDERDACLQSALLRLSPDDRNVLILRHFAELSYTEIAEALGVSDKTVKSRLHEARQRLGRMLEPRDFQ
jgi:RNA polymerase sigma-70 factor (ECF subfamily)